MVSHLLRPQEHLYVIWPVSVQVGWVRLTSFHTWVWGLSAKTDGKRLSTVNSASANAENRFMAVHASFVNVLHTGYITDRNACHPIVLI